ncbi:hypothetical protein IAD21_02888 [Abditibacteriota bacterium]|nr:hypothetical protein IAD21_02888 [Abditibacteriota bacterium]
MQPSQNPYEPPPYGQPPYAQNSAVPAVSRAPRATVSVGVISEAWSYLASNLGPWLLAMVACCAISYGVIALCTFLQDRSQHQHSSLLSFVAGLAQILPWIITQLLLGGLTKLAIGTVRTRSAKISDLWKVTNVTLSLLLSSLFQGFLYALACLPGFIVFMISIIIPIMHVGESAFKFLGTGKIPGISSSSVATTTIGVSFGFLFFFGGLLLLASLLLLATPLIVERKAGPWRANVQSIATLRRHFWSGVLLLLVLGLINIGGMLLCCVGLLLTIPLTQITIALVYRDLIGIEGIVAPPTVYAPPPIANPNI